MSKIVTTADGDSIEVAYEELALFFNNNTVEWGYNALATGMTKEEALKTLEAKFFSPVMANAFLQEMRKNVSITWVDGRIYKPGDA